MKTILLADDSTTFLKLEKVFLSSGDYEIITASNGKAVLEQLAAKIPHLVILDLVMPGIDGDRICQLIKSNDQFKHIPVIMLTTEGDEKGRKRCQDAGCDLFLTKPVSKSTLQKAVKNLLPTPD